MSGYCTIADVVACYPQFARARQASISDLQIQGWINNRKSQIRSALLTRGFDPDAPPNGSLDTDQTNFLKSLNIDGTASDFGDALTSVLTLQPGEVSVADQRRKSFNSTMKDINNAMHDRLFQAGPKGNVARTRDVRPLAGGIGGAETDPSVSPADRGENRAFWKNKVY